MKSDAPTSQRTGSVCQIIVLRELLFQERFDLPQIFIQKDIGAQCLALSKRLYTP